MQVLPDNWNDLESSERLRILSDLKRNSIDRIMGNLERAAKNGTLKRVDKALVLTKTVLE